MQYVLLNAWFDDTLWNESLQPPFHDYLQTLMKMLVFACGNIANLFFLVLFFSTFFQFVIYKVNLYSLDSCLNLPLRVPNIITFVTEAR